MCVDEKRRPLFQQTNNVTFHQAISRHAPWWKFRMEKSRILVYNKINMKGIISVVQTLASAHTQKSSILFLNFSMSLFWQSAAIFWLHFFFSKSSYMSWLLPYLFGTVPQSFPRGCLLGYGPWCEHACSVAKLCLTLCDAMDRSPPGSSVHGILQARILEWVAMPSSSGSSQPRD